MDRKFRLISIKERKSKYGQPIKLLVKYEDEYGKHSCTVTILSRNHMKYCPESAEIHCGDFIAVIRLGQFGIFQLHQKKIISDCFKQNGEEYMTTVPEFSSVYPLLDAVRKYLTGGMK